MEISGRVALITGGAGGIGAALAAVLLDHGMRIALADLDDRRLAETVEKLGAGPDRIVSVPLDVTDFASWQAAVASAEAAIGPIAMLVNAAGIGGGRVVAEDDPARWKLVMEVNALGPFLGCRTLLPMMLARKDEAHHILNIASLAGIHIVPTMASYAASKHALVGLIDSLRVELADTNVSLSLVYPGMVRTGFAANSRNQILAQTDHGEDLQDVGDLLEAGMDPMVLARRVIDGVKAGEYHIFTHPGWRSRLESYVFERLDACDRGVIADYEEPLDALDEKLGSRL